MTQQSPFAFSDPSTQHRFEERPRVHLERIIPGKTLQVMFPSESISRVLVPIHWPKGSGKSRKCEGSIYCEDCVNNARTTFHLYAGAYTYPRCIKVILDLCTEIPKRWSDEAPQWDCVYQVFRYGKKQEVHVTPADHVRWVYDKRVAGWDVLSDVLRIFQGRTSLAIAS